MNTQDNDIETVVAEFREKCNEVRRDTHWGDAEDGPVHEFGLKTQRGDELFTITDFGNMEKWLRAALTAQREAGKKEGFEIGRAQALKEAVEAIEQNAEISDAMLKSRVIQILQSLTDKT